MAIKTGNIIHVGNGTYLVNRIQTGGPGQVNIKRETVREVGNYESVGQITDTPDLSFSLESYDVSCAVEALILGLDPTVTPGANSYDLSAGLPVDIKSAFKGGLTAASPYATVDSVMAPFLALESMSYKFGLKNDAAQTATLRGSELYYNPGSTYVQSVVGSGVANQTIVTTNPAYAVTEGGVQRRILSVTTKTKRLNLGTDYTESYGTVTAGAATTTVTVLAAVAATDYIRISYASPTVESFPQSVHKVVTGTSGTIASSLVGVTSLTTNSGTVAFNVGDVVILDDGLATQELVKITAATGSAGAQTLTVTTTAFAHAANATIAQFSPTVVPAAIRGRDIDVYINSVKKISVQSVDVTWKVTLEQDEEFGNYHYVTQDFEVPDVSGTIVFKPRDAAEMLSLMQQLSGVTDPLQSAAATTSPAINVQIVLKNPADGNVLKRITIPDARFDLPGYSAKPLQKLDFTTKFTSDTGAMTVADH